MKKIDVQRLTPEAFEPYGRVFQPPTGTPLAETDAFSFWSDVVAVTIDGEAEVGWCVVRAHQQEIDWFEKHDRTPEMLIPVDAPFILPVMDDDGNVEALVVEIGEAVVIDRGVWHSACLPADGRDSASYFVIFRRGTPAEDVEKTTVPGFRVESATPLPGM